MLSMVQTKLINNQFINITTLLSTHWYFKALYAYFSTLMCTSFLYKFSIVQLWNALYFRTFKECRQWVVRNWYISFSSSGSCALANILRDRECFHEKTMVHRTWKKVGRHVNNYCKLFLETCFLRKTGGIVNACSILQFASVTQQHCSTETWLPRIFQLLGRTTCCSAHV